MSTSKPSMLDLENDLPPTEEDVEAMRRSHRASLAIGPKERAKLLKAFPPASYEELRRRPVFRGEPFEL